MIWFKDPCVYILASRRYRALYIGMSTDLHGRMQEHIQGIFAGHTKTYGITKLVYYEMQLDLKTAIRREKRLKRWNRAWKFRLIESMNPNWDDLYDAREDAVLEAPADRRREAGGSADDIGLDGPPPSRG
jgi:putative endonuclease